MGGTGCFLRFPTISAVQRSEETVVVDMNNRNVQATGANWQEVTHLFVTHATGASK